MADTTTIYPMAPPPTPRLQTTAIRRGEVYCDKDFWSRSAAWFAQQQEQLRAQQAQLDRIREQLQQEQKEQQQKAKAVKKTPRWASTATPTRVQPARAAKGKKRHVNEEGGASTAPVQKKVKTLPTPIQLPTPSPTPSPPPEVPVDLNMPYSDYMLDPAWATTSLSTFQAAIDSLLEGRRTTLSQSCFWSMSKPMTPPSPSSSFACVNQWCPIVALPLACTDMRFCSHGRSWPPSFVSVAAAAYMSPPPTPPADAVRFQTKPFAELCHIQERTVSLAGLHFAVDMCNGMLRVYMV